MDKSTAMKAQVLEMLKDFMMGEHGKKMKPAAISVEVIEPVKKGKAGLADVLNRASEEAPEMGDVDGDGDHDLHDHALEKEAKMYEDVEEGEVPDEEEEEYCEGGRAKKRSLRDFFDR